MPIYGSTADRSQFKNYRDEVRIFRLRVGMSIVSILALVGILFYRFYDLQIVNYQAYVTASDRNRIHVRPIPPKRGLIYDRNGVLLAENKPSYTLTITKERVKDLNATLDRIGELVELDQSDRDRFYKALKRARRPYEPVPLRFKLTEQEISRIAVNEYELKGVQVSAQLVRHYPHKELFAHTTGYVGSINSKELAQFTEEDMWRYGGTHSIGKIGLEKYYEADLIGTPGEEQVETNAHGRLIRVLDRQDPVPGKDLHLHIDIELQKTAVNALGENRGAVVAIDVESGGVVARVSAPSFDPNLFVTGISYQDYSALNGSHDLPLFNRTVQGQYPPGSTLKPMLGLGALEQNTVTPEWTIRDPGFYQVTNSERIYRDWKRWGHGNNVDLRQAIEESCDVYFYDLAIRMGIDVMHPVGSRFGLGELTGIDIPNEREGLWPSRAWKRGARGLPWFPGDSLNVSIGQGFVLTTPLQLAVMTATLASRGDRKKPQLVERVGDSEVLPWLESFYVADVEHWDYVFLSMQGVVHATRGTAKGISKGINYKIAGKTGTAQVVGIAQGEEYDREAIDERNRDHALFVAFAPVSKPEIAIAIIVENGESGSGAAAPIARKMFDTWFVIQGSSYMSTPEEAELSLIEVVE